MTHLLDPSQIRDDAQYCAALDELVRLIEDYEIRRDGYDLERMKRALAESG
jgi:hypothetical protein